jgi:hypothetical protein
MTRKLTVVENLSLDGVMQAPVARTRTSEVDSSTAAGRSRTPMR